LSEAFGSFLLIQRLFHFPMSHRGTLELVAIAIARKKKLRFCAEVGGEINIDDVTLTPNRRFGDRAVSTWMHVARAWTAADKRRGGKA
jgi:hypothetical protein